MNRCLSLLVVAFAVTATDGCTSDRGIGPAPSPPAPQVVASTYPRGFDQRQASSWRANGLTPKQATCAVAWFMSNIFYSGFLADTAQTAKARNYSVPSLVLPQDWASVSYACSIHRAFGSAARIGDT